MHTKDKPRQRRRTIAALAGVAALAAIGYWIALPVSGSDGIGALPQLSKEPAHSPASARLPARPTTGRVSLAGATEPTAASLPLPPAGARLAQIYDELKARAERGEAAAALRLYHDLNSCYAVQRMQGSIEHSGLLLDNDTAKLSPAELKAKDEDLERMQEDLQVIRANGERCADVTSEQIASLVPVTLRAAQLGDVNAIDCYVGQYFGEMPGLIDHPEWLSDLRLNTAALTDSAVRHGDWIAVELLQRAYYGVLDGTPVGQTFAPDRASAYRYLRLERLGASDANFAGKLERLLAVTAAGITPQQIAAADDWARDAHARYFHGSTSDKLADGANVCRYGDD